ncbi:hypothetical protein [Arthrobacter sp. MMS24-S77]
MKAPEFNEEVSDHIPFSLTALGLVSSDLALVRRHIRIVNIAVASMLISLGVLMVTGVRGQWINHLQNLAGTFLTPI